MLFIGCRNANVTSFVKFVGVEMKEPFNKIRYRPMSFYCLEPDTKIVWKRQLEEETDKYLISTHNSQEPT